MFAGIVFIVAGLLLLAYEFWTIFTHRPTISQQVWALYQEYPPIGFLFGLLIGLLGGHLFWNQ
jgi:hypothetical protein